MKIQNYKIDSFCRNLKNNPHAILLYGADYGLINERVKLIINSFLNIDSSKNKELNIIDFDSNDLLLDPELLEIETKSLSLLSAKKLIRIKANDDKALHIIQKYIKSPQDSCLLIILSNNLTPRSKLRQYFEKEKSIVILPCYLDEKKTISDLIKNTFIKENIHAERETIELLANYLGVDRQVTISEIEKAVLLAGKERKLTKSDVLSFIEDASSINIDELYDTSLEGNIEESLKILFRIQSQGINAMQIIRSFVRQNQNLIMLKTQSINNNIDYAIDNFKPPIFFKRKIKIKNHFLKWPTNKITKALQILNSAEIYCKSPKSSPDLIVKQTVLALGLMAQNIKN